MKSSPPPVIQNEPSDEQDTVTDTTISEEIHPVTTRLLSYYLDSPPFFPDVLMLLGFTILIGIGVGVHFASVALIPLSFEGTFWSSIWLTLLFCILFFSMRVTNFPILFTTSLTGSILAVVVAHLYIFIVFRSILLSSPEGLNATTWNCITTYLFMAPNTLKNLLIPRQLFDWAFLIIQSTILVAVGAIPPFCVFIMHEVDDR